MRTPICLLICCFLAYIAAGSICLFFQFAEMEAILGDTDRARAIMELAIGQPRLEMPEVLWKAYIDFEMEQEEFGKTRSLYQRLLQRTKHVKVEVLNANSLDMTVALVVKMSVCGEFTCTWNEANTLAATSDETRFRWWSIVISVSVCLFLSVCSHISTRTQQLLRWANVRPQ